MSKKNKSLLIWLAVILLIAGLGWWMYKGIADLPGIAVSDQGRDHKSNEENANFVYNSNPPTSGPHNADWIRAGVYASPQDKYKLIHSLEHGYIVVHYNCARPISNFQFPIFNQFSMIQIAKAHEDEGDADKDSTPSAEIKTECALGKMLADFGTKMGMKKLIVTPDETIKFPVVMTAWNRILEMPNFDEKLATKFVKSFRDKGPELTME